MGVFECSYTTETDCVAAGCCWSQSAELSPCYIPNVAGYKVLTSDSSPGIIVGNLSLSTASGLFDSPDYDMLSLNVVQETNGRTHITISPTGVSRWRIPDELIQRPGGLYTGEAPFPGGFYTQASIESVDPFVLQVTRINGGVSPQFNDVIFNITKNLVFQDQYVQFSLTSPDDVVATYGFGESTRTIQRLQTGTRYSLWASDIGSSNFNVSLYGSHPLIIQVLSSGKAHGVFFMNSNAMELTITVDENGRENLGIQSTGGILEFYVFGGPTPAEVVRQYLEVVGLPAMVPYWSLGFHNCRWGYESVGYVQEVVTNYSRANIPLQTQWMDIDYMNE
jgi:alpha-glucosidase (family GH31 glycosyl hydrolase)